MSYDWINIPVPFTTKIDKNGAGEMRRWRTVFNVGPHYGMFFVGFFNEYASLDKEDWHSAAGYWNFTIGFSRRFAFGRTHDYYDGPHDSFSLGFIHFNWQGDWCKKCAGDE